MSISDVSISDVSISDVSISDGAGEIAETRTRSVAGMLAPVPEAGEPLVYIGGISAARSAATLVRFEVTHIVELTATGIDQEGFAHDGVEYLRINIQDQPRERICEHFSAVNKFIHRARQHSGSIVFIHCSYGTSRSVAAACAYFVQWCDLTLADALAACKRAWPTAAPNIGFARQLVDWEIGLHNKTIGETAALIDSDDYRPQARAPTSANCPAPPAPFSRPARGS